MASRRAANINAEVGGSTSPQLKMMGLISVDRFAEENDMDHRDVRALAASHRGGSPVKISRLGRLEVMNLSAITAKINATITTQSVTALNRAQKAKQVAATKKAIMDVYLKHFEEIQIILMNKNTPLNEYPGAALGAAPIIDGVITSYNEFYDDGKQIPILNRLHVSPVSPAASSAKGVRAPRAPKAGKEVPLEPASEPASDVIDHIAEARGI